MVHHGQTGAPHTWRLWYTELTDVGFGCHHEGRGGATVEGGATYISITIGAIMVPTTPPIYGVPPYTLTCKPLLYIDSHHTTLLWSGKSHTQQNSYSAEEQCCPSLLQLDLLIELFPVYSLVIIT